MQKTAILILAAGKSTRMGTVKQLLPFKKSTLLNHCINQALQSKTDSVFCVLGAYKELITKEIKHLDITVVFNSNYKDGLSSSIVAGIHELKAKNFDSVLIMLADQPNINTTYLNELIQISKKNPFKIIASNYKAKIGVPAIFSKNYFNQLLTLKGDKGATKLLNEKASEIIKMRPFNLIDIDTKEEYQKLVNKIDKY